LQEKQANLKDKDGYIITLQNELDEISDQLEKRIESHCEELKNFESEKEQIQKDCSEINCKVGHEDLKIDAMLLDEDGELLSALEDMQKKKYEMIERMSIIRPAIIQIRLDDLRKVDKQVN